MIILNLKIAFPTYYLTGYFGQYILLTIGTIFIIRILFTYFIEFGGVGLFSDLERRMSGFPFNQMSKERLMFVNVFGGSIPIFVATLASTLYESSIVVNQSAKEAALLKSEKLEAELKFLKSQINPHFLFNSLNNIYTLTVLNPSMAGKNLLKLSEMLRYLLYECDAEKVALGRELTYLQNYIDLFSLKDEECLNITFDAKDVNKEIMIAPLLLIPFVENAFKHSQIEDLEKGWISISILGDTKQVYFEIKNSLPEIVFSKDEVGGIGLQNVQRQLELLYPNKHQLKIDKENGYFGVYLTIYI